MFDAKQLKAMAAQHSSISTLRRELQKTSSDILGASKRAIFAVQRSDAKVAKQEIDAATTSIKSGFTIVKKEPRLTHEGMWRAALEEFLEATFYHAAMTKKSVGEVRNIPIDSDLFIGAMSDLTGELTRSCVLAATERDVKEVHRLQELVKDAVAFLLTLDLTGNNRQKFDQAKQNLRKIEEIAFNVSLHVKT